MNIRSISLVLITTMCMVHGSAGAQGAGSSAAAASARTPEEVDKLLGPIALYPDALVIQILQCAGSPYQIKQVNDWLKSNPDLKGAAVQDAAAAAGFDASFIAIVLFPEVLQMMADKPDWTRDLGEAFTTQRDDVLASVQRLRKQAQSMGNLSTNQQQQVQTVTVESGDQVIVIQPANPQVVYVPQYDPQVVYVQSAPTEKNNASVGAAAIIGFAAGVIVGAAADDDTHVYYYHSGGWGYPRPICYSGGYNSYYQHRENMANDYYRHREAMAAQRGENQGQRQDARGDTRETRQAQQDQNQAARTDNRSDRQATAGESRSENQTQRQSRADQRQATPQTNRASLSSRGAYDSSSQFPATTDRSRGSAFSGIQSGASERASSERGQRSLSGGGRSAGGELGGGSGQRSGGGRR